MGAEELFSYKPIDYKKNKGFTLAEVIIVIGIIGIIAAMIIPSIMNDFRDRAYVMQLKKTINTLQNALTNAIAVEGPMDSWYNGTVSDDATDSVNDILSKYLQLAKNCKRNTGQGCVPASYKYLSSSVNGNYNVVGDGSTMASKMVFSNGSTFTYYVVGPSSTSIGYILGSIDVNGLKEPNRYGYDVFQIYIYGDEYAKANGFKSEVVIPRGSTTLAPQEVGCNKGSSSSRGTITGTGFECTAWAYYMENEDYKYVTDLNWITKQHK